MCVVGRRHRRTKMTRGQRSVIFFRRRLRLAARYTVEVVAHAHAHMHISHSHNSARYGHTTVCARV